LLQLNYKILHHSAMAHRFGGSPNLLYKP